MAPTMLWKRFGVWKRCEDHIQRYAAALILNMLKTNGAA